MYVLYEYYSVDMCRCFTRFASSGCAGGGTPGIAHPHRAVRCAGGDLLVMFVGDGNHIWLENGGFNGKTMGKS